MIQHKEIELVPLENEDLEFILTWFNEMPLTRLVRTKKMLNKEELLSLVESMRLQDDNLLFSVKKNSKTHIGFAFVENMDWFNSTATIKTYVDVKDPNCSRFDKLTIELLVGYLISKLGINRVSTEVLISDVYQTKLYKDVGFKPEVKKRNHYFTGGKFHHVVEMALLAERR